DVLPSKDTSVGIVGQASSYARSDHQHPIQTVNTIPNNDSADGSYGTVDSYARNDHSHPINVQTNASIVPIVNGVGNNGTSAYYSRHDHIHPQQLTYDGNVTATKFIQTGGSNQQILLADGTNKAITDFSTSVTPRAYQIDPVDDINTTYVPDLFYQIKWNLRIQNGYTIRFDATQLGTLSDQWNIAVTEAGEFRIGLGSQVIQANKGLIISADGNTLSFNGSVIAGTGATTGASNGSVNYSAGNSILWGVNSVDTNGGFYSDGPKIYWRAKPVTLGAVPP
ncbi:MAG: hypothetical protein EZS28_042391, partial [Streblomastix strix]